MKLQTQVPLKPQEHAIDYHSKIFLIGSCFVENIAAKCDYFKFQHLQNPFGILFHPMAIERFLKNAMIEKRYTQEDTFWYNEQWHSYDAHSKLSHVSQDILIQQLNNALASTKQFIALATHIIITFGTAWVYQHKKSHTLVANCHKVSQSQFLKRLLSVEELTQSLEGLISLIRSVNKNTTIILTVSPVRHIKDGVIENTLSKAHLVAAIHRVLSKNAAAIKTQYFPSYEIMLDELRDYRFYKEDLLHPNNIAVNYIWEKFKQVWINDKAYNTMTIVEGIQKDLKHKPFNVSSKAHQQFLGRLKLKQKQLQDQFPYIRF